MKTLEDGKNRIQKICDVLTKETLEPAHQEAEKILNKARNNAEKIIADAKKHAEELLDQAKKGIEQERRVFKSSLLQAGKQGVESLKQEIEEKLFNQELNQLIVDNSVDPKVIAKLINCVTEAIKKDGISSDLSAIIPQEVSADSVNKLLLTGVVDKLQEKSVVVGSFSGGAQLRLNDKKMTIDISDEAIKELLTAYIRKDFREMIFGK